MSFQASMIVGGHAQLPAYVTPAAQAPVQYERAVQALQAVQTIDEARQFSTAAEALSAWAKVYGDDRVATEARRLKLHAFRRIGILAQQLRPQSTNSRGPMSLLREQGFKKHDAQSAVAVARMPEPAFNREIARLKPRTAGGLMQVELRKNPAAARLAIRLQGLLTILRKKGMDRLVQSMAAEDLAACQARINELRRLVNDMQQHIDRRSAPSPPEKQHG